MSTSKLESIRQILAETSGVNWDEQLIKREHLRREDEYYWVAGLQVFPQESILTSEELQGFSDRLTQVLVPVGPMNITKCYEYSESKRDVVKTATVYFTETIGDVGEDQGLERRITVTFYPCRIMAENMGVRATIEMGHYECDEPCNQSKKCAFRARHGGFLYEASRR